MTLLKKKQSTRFSLMSIFLMLIMSLMMSSVGAIEKITYYHNDALGSPVSATDETGNLLWREAYQPYGERLLKQGDATNNTWFTGKQEDKAAGLSYFHARWYDPVVGRFTAIDPVDFQEDNIHSFNRYAYANNNPYRYIDPDGQQSKDIFKGNPYKKLTEGGGGAGFGGGYTGPKGPFQRLFAKDKSNTKKTHGNKLDGKPAEGYTLRDRRTGEIMKYGETTRGDDKFGIGKQRRYSKKYLKENNLSYVKETSGTKKEMHQWQHQKILDYKAANNGKRPPLNKSDY